MSQDQGLLYAATPEGAAFRENGLRNMEAVLRVHVFSSPAEREQALTEFYHHAQALRALDASLLLVYYTQQAALASNEDIAVLISAYEVALQEDASSEYNRRMLTILQAEQVSRMQAGTW